MHGSLPPSQRAPNAASTAALIDALRRAVGRRHVLVGDRRTRRFRRGYRFGEGRVLAVARPGTLIEQWRVLEACVAADVIVICQAQNTGLTGGSTPAGDGYDRPIVIVSTLRIDRIDLISDGSEAICLPGATLAKLEKRLRPIGREPHSVIGSSCIGASVAGGVCNNSGGALVRRGPAYTQMALFAQVDAAGRLRLVNHLGIELGEGPEAVLRRLDAGDYRPEDVAPAGERWASDRRYREHVRDVEAETPARFNADPRRHYEASGSAGKVAVFALRLDTVPADRNTAVFYIGSNDPADLEAVRRDVLAGFASLPVAGEYMHRDAYELARVYGKDLFLFVSRFGTDHVPRAYAAKSWLDGVTEAVGLGGHLTDRLLQWLTARLPEHLPARLDEYRDRYEHHLMLRMADDGIAEARRYLAGRFPTAAGDFFECTEAEGAAAYLNRFAVGGAVVRFRDVHPAEVEDVVALDVALPRNTRDWFETLPPELTERMVRRMYCGHFLCHVLHQEYLVRRGEDCHAVEAAMLALLDARGAEYPAEHNVGHLYAAKPALRDFYRSLDPTNTFNPGIGRTPRGRNWISCEPADP